MSFCCVCILDQWTNAVIEMGGIHAVNQYGLSAVRGIRDGLTGHHDSLTSYEKMQTITQHPLKDKYADLESTASHVSSFLFLGILCSMTTMALSLSVWPYYRFEYTHRYITVPAVSLYFSFSVCLVSFFFFSFSFSCVWHSVFVSSVSFLRVPTKASPPSSAIIHWTPESRVL